MTVRLRVPRRHAQDWHSRYDEDGAELVDVTARTATFEFDDAALADLISDALYYAEEMHGENTGGVDYRGPAETLLRALGRQGYTWTRRGFSVTVTAPERPTGKMV